MELDMILVEFLLARIAEDEAAARLAIPPRWDDAEPTPHWRHDGNPSGAFMAGQMVIGQASSWREVDQDGGRFARHIVRWDPARVLAECEAKRQIIDMHTSTESVVRMLDALDNTADPVGNKTDPVALGIAQAALVTLEAVLKSHAQPYAEHPDYDEAWTFG
jgi:hypothetical protein